MRRSKFSPLAVGVALALSVSGGAALASDANLEKLGAFKTTVWSVTDRDMDNVADTVEEFSPSITFDVPAGA